MKIKFLLLSVALFILSCSKDDDPTPLQSTPISIVQNNQVIEPPAALLSSTNDYAEMVVEYIESANALSGFTSFFTIPTGAAKSTTKITASNGRIDATGDFVVYEWSDSQSGSKVAFQVSEFSDHYTWEVFIKYPTDANYLKFIHAEEKKDKSSGFLKVLDTDGANPSGAFITYSWTRSGDTLNYIITSFGSKINLTVNTKTKAGSVIYTENGVKQYEMTWDTKGNGTWKYFNNGVVASQGTWTV
jgi:hypothetical protein